MRNAFSRSFATHAQRALRPFAVPTLLALTALVTGCGDGGSGPPGPVAPAPGTITIEQANNYTLTTSSLTVPVFPAAEKENLNVCWTDVVEDIQGHQVDPQKDINDVSFVPLKNGDKHQVEEWLNLGLLDEGKVDGQYYEFKTDGMETCATLDQFASLDHVALDPEATFVVKDTRTYLMVFQTGTKIGFGARTMLFLDPSADSLETEIDAPAKSRDSLQFEANLTDPDKLTLPADKPSVIDWSGVPADPLGNELTKNSVDRILIGFYAGKGVADLEAGFLDLDQPSEAEGGATKSWELHVSKGQTANLAAASGRNGEGPFTDFSADGDGTWLMGLFCSTCQNPAPVIVTILDPQ